jgi:hypothetical protein
MDKRLTHDQASASHRRSTLKNHLIIGLELALSTNPAPSI